MNGPEARDGPGGKSDEGTKMSRKFNREMITAAAELSTEYSRKEDIRWTTTEHGALGIGV